MANNGPIPPTTPESQTSSNSIRVFQYTKASFNHTPLRLECSNAEKKVKSRIHHTWK